MQCPRCGEQLVDDARFCGACGTDLNIGRKIGRYVLRERIGTGSLGVVYRAEQTGTGRKVALKLLPHDPNQDPRVAERFRREGEVLCRLRSPHTVTTYEFDRAPDGALYIAMELSPGRSLAEVVRTEGQLEWGRVLRILAGLCDALTEAHVLGVVHRDLKPENILLESRTGDPDFVKVLDFGLAKLTHALVPISLPDQTLGAVEYSSPEQLLGRTVDARSDIYGLGVLAYLLLTGQHPFHDARGAGRLVTAHVERIPPSVSSLRRDIPASVDALVARCLEKHPDRRFTHAPALADAIQVVLGARPSNPSMGFDDTWIANSEPGSRK